MSIIEHAFHQYDALANVVVVAHGVLPYVPRVASNSDNSNLGSHEGRNNVLEYSVESEEQCSDTEQGSLYVPPPSTFHFDNNDDMIL